MIWKRVRGFLGVAITWGLAWGVLGSAWAAAQLWWIRRHNSVFQKFSIPDVLPSMFLFWGLLGALSGAIFAGLVVRLEGHRSINDLVPGRVAAWGALGGASLPLVAAAFGALAGQVPSDWLSAPLISGALGAICATTSLHLARPTSRVDGVAPPTSDVAAT